MGLVGVSDHKFMIDLLHINSFTSCHNTSNVYRRPYEQPPLAEAQTTLEKREIRSVEGEYLSH